MGVPRHEKPFELGKRLWVEDDATLNDPDAEKVGAAWRRLFGEGFDPGLNAVGYHDGGDHFQYLMSNGAVAVSAFDGWSIWQGTWQDPKAKSPHYWDSWELVLREKAQALRGVADWASGVGYGGVRDLCRKAAYELDEFIRARRGEG